MIFSLFRRAVDSRTGQTARLFPGVVELAARPLLGRVAVSDRSRRSFFSWVGLVAGNRRGHRLGRLLAISSSIS